MKYTYKGKTVEVDPTGPFVDVVDELFDLGMSSEDAQDEALRLVEKHG